MQLTNDVQFMLEVFQDRRAVLVCNAAHVFELQTIEVDAFDVVVRVNQYQLNSSYSKYIGTRTDVVVSGFFANRIVYEEVTKMISPLPMTHFRGHMKARILSSERFYPNATVFCPGEEDYKQWDKTNKWLTSGTSGVLQILHYGKPSYLYVMGMGFYSNKSRSYYYHPNKINRIRDHDIESEKAIIKKIYEEGKIDMDGEMKSILGVEQRR